MAAQLYSGEAARKADGKCEEGGWDGQLESRVGWLISGALEARGSDSAPPISWRHGGLKLGWVFHFIFVNRRG